MTPTDLGPDVVELTTDLSASPLWNPDLAPTPAASRTWSTYHIAALWIGMSVVITTYTLASGLMQQGMTWAQAMLTILLGNTIVLIPMMLNAHAGTKYGVSFPVLCRAAFGVKGPTFRHCCARSSPAAGSGSRPGLAGSRCMRSWGRRFPAGCRCPATCGSPSRHSGRCRSRSSCGGWRGSRRSRAGQRHCCWAAARCSSAGRSTAAAGWATS